ncbi:hypothetical protein BCR39DRAFT_540012 [Naematelia encephala]|uniref:Uncharacterized protein n=1 Tax=Naematelia encephala TaxID=71784 RepID=A0A1Y2AXE8_9TREE|nr:hypothetical protein BCR39DRAFT_540012 [Naematelia encephala]
MDEGLFLFMLFFGFVLFFSIIYCFLSSCLGVQIRRSDIWEALTLSTPSTIRERERMRRMRGQEQFELDEMDAPSGVGVGTGGLGWDDRFGSSAEGVEAMRRSGMSRGFF